PVISLVTDPDNLFDPDYGIYVLGNTADTTFNDIPFPNANFWQGWRRPADVTFFDKQHQQGFQTEASISIQGNWSKMFPQRGFYVDADEDFGGDPVNYKLFPDKPATSYHGFNIRNMGTDWNGAMMRDRCIQKIAQPATYLDVMDGFPCVVFINGIYWGVYEVREKQDKHFIENNSEVDDDNVDMLQFDGDIIEGDNQDFLNMALYIGNTDMSIAANYDTAMRMIDRENFCDYFITETYVANTDWLGQYTNNIKYWRMQTPEGKWRYILWDTDLSWGANGPFNADMLDNAIHPAVNNPHSDMLRSLLDNPSFRNYFINRYADLMNTAYLPVNIEKSVRKIEAEMAPEMDRNFDLWGNANSSFAPLILQWPCDTNQWGQQVDDMLLFTQLRLPFARTYVQTQFGLIQQVNLTLDVFPAGAGSIRLNTIVPDSLPWSGIYYDGAPVTMTVQPATGFRFLYWRANNVMLADNPNPSITINLNDSTTFTAIFEVLELNFTAYPNPFFDALTVTYSLPSQAQVSLRIFNAQGQVVAEPLSPNTFQPAGVHTLSVDPDVYGLAGGVYFFELITGDYRKVIPVIAGRPKP
ncbi:MAG: CotH kinase family protein, partial [Bacteroidia bacterium]